MTIQQAIAAAIGSGEIAGAVAMIGNRAGRSRSLQLVRAIRRAVLR